MLMMRPRRFEQTFMVRSLSLRVKWNKVNLERMHIFNSP